MSEGKTIQWQLPVKRGEALPAPVVVQALQVVSQALPVLAGYKAKELVQVSRAMAEGALVHDRMRRRRRG
jgi:hypothetical protein